MELMLDSADLSAIKKYKEILPISGVTTNPSIVKKVGRVDFVKQMQEIRQVIGSEKSLHIQVVAQDYEGILKDAEAILKRVDDSAYIKIPVTENGLKAIKKLKADEVKITATAIYSKFQAYSAIAAGADYIAPYFNRMENFGVDAAQLIQEMAQEIERTKSSTKILAASFKNIAQVNKALEKGAQSVTVSPDILSSALNFPALEVAVNDFQKDWESLFGRGENLTSLLNFD